MSPNASPQQSHKHPRRRSSSGKTQFDNVDKAGNGVIWSSTSSQSHEAPGDENQETPRATQPLMVSQTSRRLLGDTGSSYSRHSSPATRRSRMSTAKQMDRLKFGNMPLTV